MPIYEYECQACGHRFEEWQKMADEPIKVCPKCAAPKVEKLISHTSFQLKGGGWYSDLYSSTKPSSGSSESSSTSGSSSGSSTGGASTTPSSPTDGGGKGSGNGSGKKGAKAAA
jgi:putative FmdB family regulatory protein